MSSHLNGAYALDESGNSAVSEGNMHIISGVGRYGKKEVAIITYVTIGTAVHDEPMIGLWRVGVTCVSSSKGTSMT